MPVNIVLNVTFFLLVIKEAANSSSETENNDELEQITIARALVNYRLKEEITMANPNAPIPFPKKFPIQSLRPPSPQPPSTTTSKILPLICQKTAPRNKPPSMANESPLLTPETSSLDGWVARPQKFPAAGAVPYVPRRFRTPCHSIAQPVTIRTAVPVYSAPPLPMPSKPTPQVMWAPSFPIAPPVSIRHAVPVFATPPTRKEDHPPAVRKEDPPAVSAPAQRSKSQAQVEETKGTTANNLQ